MVAEAGIFAAHQVSPEMREAAEGWAGLRLSQPTAPITSSYTDICTAAICDELGQVYHKKAVLMGP